MLIHWAKRDQLHETTRGVDQASAFAYSHKMCQTREAGELVNIGHVFRVNRSRGAEYVLNEGNLEILERKRSQIAFGTK